MRENKKSEILVGITVLTGIIIIILVIGWAKNISFSDDRVELKINFNSVAGLVVGDPVTVNGVKKGFVENIQLAEPGVLVIANVEKNIFLKHDAEFSVMMLDLMGGKKLEIKPGISEEFIDYSEIQKGSFKGDISTAMSTLSSLETDFIYLVQNLKLTVESINKIVGDDKFTSDLKSSVATLNQSVGSLKILLDENRKEISSLIKNSNKFVNKTSDFISENSDSLSGLIGSANKTFSKVELLVSNLNSLILETQEKKNNLGKALYDESMLNEFNATAKEIKGLMMLLKKQLEEEGIKVDASIF